MLPTVQLETAVAGEGAGGAGEGAGGGPNHAFPLWVVSQMKGVGGHGQSGSEPGGSDSGREKRICDSPSAQLTGGEMACL